MARQFENSIDRFAQGSSNTLFIAFAAALVLLLLVGCVVSLAARYWLSATIFLVSAGAAAGFVVFANAQRKKLIASRAAGWIDWQAAQPEIQRQNLNIAVGELSKILQVGDESINDLQSAFIVAEDLALRQIQQEEQVPLLRHLSVAGVPFDAIYSKQDLLVCVEVSFLVGPELRQERVVSMIKKITSVKRSVAEMNIGTNVRLMVVLITQMPEEDLERLRTSLGTSRFSSTPVDIDIRFLDFETLQKIYVTE